MQGCSNEAFACGVYIDDRRGATIDPCVPKTRHTRRNQGPRAARNQVACNCKFTHPVCPPTMSEYVEYVRQQPQVLALTDLYMCPGVLSCTSGAGISLAPPPSEGSKRPGSAPRQLCGPQDVCIREPCICCPFRIPLPCCRQMPSANLLPAIRFAWCSWEQG